MSDASFVNVRQASKSGPAVVKITCPAVGQREAPILEEEFKPILTGAGHRIALDMGAVTVLGSMGLGLLVTLTKRCRDGGGKLAIFAMAPSLLELIKITKLDKLLIIAPDEATAVGKLG